MKAVSRLVIGALLLCQACSAPWRVKPAESSPIERVDGRASGYRVCFRDESVQSALLETNDAKLEGTMRQVGGKPCGYFFGPVAKTGIEEESHLTVTKQPPSGPERMKFSAPERTWVTNGKWDVETRLGLADAVKGASGPLTTISGSVLYRISRFGIGPSPELAFTLRRVMVGWGASANATLDLRGNWSAILEANYAIGMISWKGTDFGTVFYHGPKAFLSVGWGGEHLRNGPPANEQPTMGPFIGGEYIMFPGGHRPIVLVNGGWQFRL